jgi:hypothetical protein
MSNIGGAQGVLRTEQVHPDQRFGNEQTFLGEFAIFSLVWEVLKHRS